MVCRQVVLLCDVELDMLSRWLQSLVKVTTDIVFTQTIEEMFLGSQKLSLDINFPWCRFPNCSVQGFHVIELPGRLTDQWRK